MKAILAWHFVGNTLRDGRPIPKDDELLEHKGKLEMCVSGLHASRRIIDALRYAPGNTVCRVKVSGKIIKDTDKLVASERKILWRLDAEDILRAFAREQALSVANLWQMPDIVRQYLETGNESLMATAWAAVEAAARAAAGAAAGAAAWAATRAAAWAATRAAAGDAAGDAAGAAAWAAVEAAARAAANKQLQKLVMAARKDQVAK